MPNCSSGKQGSAVIGGTVVHEESAELHCRFGQETVSVARTVGSPFLDRDPDSFGYRQAILHWWTGTIQIDDPPGHLPKMSI